jgi:sodium-dependent dicarboxylate transporter 2/3/5
MMNSVLAVAAWMVIWWVSETVSISVTALLPIVLFPLVGVYDVGEVSSFYGHKIIFLFMGGFIIALGMERWNLHKRIALQLIKFTGSSASGVILGFMLATALISMWISNTATTVMMLPIAISVNDIIRKSNQGNKHLNKFSLGLFLGIAYAANIGGTATIIGTPPNVVMVSILESSLNIDITFARFMLVGVPLATIMFVITFLILSRGMKKEIDFVDIRPLIRKKQQVLGRMTKQEKRVLTIFVATALLWILRGPINHLLDKKLLNDYIISMAGGLAMFMVPSNFKEHQFLLDWKQMKQLPWGILILFGGGLSLAGALETSGVINEISKAVLEANFQNIGWYILILSAIALFMTELMSNVALTTVFLPVVIGIAIGIEANAIYLCIPVTLAASFAFMLPISTPPNAIVFSSGHITIQQMMRKGVLLNVIAILLLWMLSQLLIPLVF